MPKSAADFQITPYLRLCILGAPKVGKTHCTLESCDKPAYVIDCDGEQSLLPATRVTKEFTWDEVTALDDKVFKQMEDALMEATRGAREGRYKTIVWDTATSYSRNIEELLTQPQPGRPEPNKLQGYGIYGTRMRNALQRLFLLPCHVVVHCHYSEEKNDTGKVVGILPNFAGKSKSALAALFNDIVFMEKEGASRVYRTSITGVYGPGCRSIPGVVTLPADIQALIQRISAEAPAVSPKT